MAAALALSGQAGLEVRFASPAARYLYTAPTGRHRDLSHDAALAHFRVLLNTHAGAFDYPIQTTDGSFGSTVFDDFGWWQRKEQYAVPNVTPGGGFLPSSGSDGHLIVLDVRSGTAYDFWRLCTDAGGTPITCPKNRSPASVGAIYRFQLAASNGTPGATASGISGLAGDIVPGDLERAGGIGHALNAIAPASMMLNEICSGESPATWSDGTQRDGIFCEGAKLRMDPEVDVTALNASPTAKVVMRALQRYGAVITDQTGCNDCLNFYTALPGTGPDLTGLAPNVMAHLWIYYGKRRRKPRG